MRISLGNTWELFSLTWLFLLSGIFLDLLFGVSRVRLIGRGVVTHGASNRGAYVFSKTAAGNSSGGNLQEEFLAHMEQNGLARPPLDSGRLTYLTVFFFFASLLSSIREHGAMTQPRADIPISNGINVPEKLPSRTPVCNRFMAVLQMPGG